jgi:hypothetical protein
MVTALDGVKELRLYQLNGPPPAQPTAVCAIGNPAGTFASPTWSPTGNELAWQEDDGIHVAQVRDWAACDFPSALVIPGGRQPDWGPAGSDAPAPSPTPADTEVSVDVPASIGRTRLRSKGLPVAVTCPVGCTAVVRLVVKGKVRAKATAPIAAGATRTLRLKAKLPKGVRSATIRIAAAGDTGAFKVKIRG